MKVLVTGGKGFIGSHLVDALVERGDEVIVLDNGLSGDNTNPKARYFTADICVLNEISPHLSGVDVVYHLAAIARTPWCIDNPILCYETNVIGTLNVLEAARGCGVKRVVLASSNVVLAFPTPYRSSKMAVEDLREVYEKMYGQSVIALRFSNVYGKRQREDGPSPNVFAALRKSKREKGYLEITGDGEQSRDYTHVSDVVRALQSAAESKWCGVLDICTGKNTSLNTVAKYFNCPVRYIPERPGDIKHIYQDPNPAKEILSFEAKVPIEEGIRDVLDS